MLFQRALLIFLKTIAASRRALTVTTIIVTSFYLALRRLLPFNPWRLLPFCSWRLLPFYSPLIHLPVRL
jgi:hypothetical protein